jgi:hypothetical protein
MTVATFLGQRCAELRLKTLSMNARREVRRRKGKMFPLGTIKTVWRGSKDPVPGSLVLVTFKIL